MYDSALSPDSIKDVLYSKLFAGIDSRFGGLGSDYTKYRQDPVGFVENILGGLIPQQLKTLMVSVRENPVTVAQSCNAFGKTWAAARVALWFFKCFPGSQVWSSAAPPETNLRKLLWGELLSIAGQNPELFKTDRITDLNIIRSPQEFISGVAIPLSGSEAVREAKFSGKHAPAILFIVDEADAVPDEVFRGIESCMSGGLARLLCMFNPRQESGAVYRTIRDGRANVVKLSAFEHPNVVTGENRIPGAVDRETTVRRINEWCRPLAETERPGTECFDLPSFLAGETARSKAGHEFPALKPGWYRILDPAFSYMVLGQYPAQAENQLISREWIAMARSRWDAYTAQHGENPPATTRPVAGLDVAEYGGDRNVLIFRAGGFVSRPITWGGMDPNETAEKAAIFAKERKALRVVADSIGVGAAVPGGIRAAGSPAVGVKTSERATSRTEIGEFNRLRDQLWWEVREWLRTDPGAMLPPDEELIEELTVTTYEVRDGRIRIMAKEVMRELLKRSPDRADALCLTFNRSGLLFPEFS